MLTVHHLGLSQSERIVWLCEELELDYQLKRYERRADNRLAPDEYKALHPMGIAPLITDGDLGLSLRSSWPWPLDAQTRRSGFRRPPVLVSLVQRHLHDHNDDATGHGHGWRRQPGGGICR